ncbi:Response regulator, LuxR family (fragment) [Nitrospira defluvii]|jgi:DNA-binding NarL/FixJ family response regulator|uniref:Response regulator, LuxR family n=1 Tax=Nitrospira defluvii TaxID=330214 RepID=D8PC52_9BACT
MWSEQQSVVQVERDANAQGSTPGIPKALGGGLPTKRRPEELTPREQEILQLVWAGLTNRTIAEQLHISIKTAEAHRANMMKKLRVSNIAQLLKTALEEGLLATHAG